MANGKRGRAPKPTSLLKLNGTYREDRHGKNHPEPEGAPARPEHLCERALALWDSIVPELVELGVAARIDQKNLEAMCDWWAQYETARRQQDLKTKIAAWNEFSKIACKFGLSPADRRGLDGMKQNKKNPFEQYLASRQGKSTG